MSIPPDKFIGTVAASVIIGCTESYVRQLLRNQALSGIKVAPRAWIVEKESAKRYAKTKHSRGRPRGSRNISE